MNKTNMPQFPEPYWRDSIDFSPFPPLDKSIQVDVGIVGGGITGITAAYLLSKQNVKVALIDAGVMLNGTTGHTTAKVTAQHGLIYDELINHFGEEKASMYYHASDEARQFIKDTVSEYNIDCDFKEEDAYLFTNDNDYLQSLEKEKEAYEKLNIPHELMNRMPLKVPMMKALMMKNQAAFHPLKYLNKLIEISKNNGVDFYENTTATDVEYNNHPAIVTREGNRILCKYVIAASHYPFYDGQGFYPTRMYADRSYVLAVKPKRKYPGGMYINAEEPTRSIRTTTIDDQDLWLVGGESHKTGQGKNTYNYYESLFDFAKKEFGINKVFYRWSAQDLITLDKVPYIGPITKNQRNIFVATGYRKWGMTNGTVAAHVISDIIINKESPYEELYTPSRFQADPAVKKFTQINADVAKHLIKGKLEYTKKNIDELEPDQATITRIEGKRTGVYKDRDQKIHMVDTTCTHLGCEVEWNAGERTWDCPCHGSRYSYTGEIINGPAKQPLKVIEQ